jgi:hypothetical protein
VGTTELSFSETYWTFTIKNSANLISDIVSIFMEEMDEIKTFANITPACIFQPLTADMISHFGKNGGNALGISLADGPLICRHFPLSNTFWKY